jgi:hypothetical protein
MVSVGIWIYPLHQAGDGLLAKNILIIQNARRQGGCVGTSVKLTDQQMSRAMAMVVDAYESSPKAESFSKAPKSYGRERELRNRVLYIWHSNENTYGTLIV